MTSEGLDEPREFWWDTLERIFASASPVPAVLELRLGGRSLTWRTGTQAERAAAHRTIHDALVHASLADRQAVLARVMEWSGLRLPPRDSHRPVTGPELSELATRPGHAIGAHTVHHLHLPSQPLEVQRREIDECQAQLQRWLGYPVRTFAYPYGAVNPETTVVVRAASFQVAVTADGGLVQPGTDPVLVPRIEISPAVAARFPGYLQAFFGR